MSDTTNQTEPVKTETNQEPEKRPRSWKRKIIIIAVILAVVFGGILTVALLNLESLIESNRELIFAQIEKALGREFTAEGLKVSIFTGGRVQLTNITIADDPQFSKEPFFRADEFQVGVAIMPLLHKEIQLGKLVVVRPQITVVRDTDGVLNVSTIGAGGTEPAPETSTPTELPPLAVRKPRSGARDALDSRSGHEKRIQSRQPGPVALRPANRPPRLVSTGSGGAFGEEECFGTRTGWAAR